MQNNSSIGNSAFEKARISLGLNLPFMSEPKISINQHSLFLLFFILICRETDIFFFQRMYTKRPHTIGLRNILRLHIFLVIEKICLVCSIYTAIAINSLILTLVSTPWTGFFYLHSIRKTLNSNPEYCVNALIGLSSFTQSWDLIRMS